MGDSVVLLDEPQAVDKFANVALLMDSHWGNEGKAYTSDVDGEPFQVEFGVRSSFQACHAWSPPTVVLTAVHPPFSLSARFDPEQARVLAKALLQAADVVEPLRVQWLSIVQAGGESCSSP
jgi:hypothetical protein